ncbi:rSAM-modified peptide [Flavobacterium crocinum]|uniref:RSAM-modified peptide n=1 Tax=Flavobacterium crocinum TaxID=2183896 RepID=A0A2S1YIN9_9FLAO|nr:rSAM-modified peptide [Flavobacterium crocinum]AWK03912.1 rSAM-modified peptide [Flavobacterium crocinum]AWK03914.1 rSAM-modified peptide [Flavobacterium crocinum]
MKTTTYTFKDFQKETISKKEQKTIIGGGGDEVDPGRGKGNGNG